MQNEILNVEVAIIGGGPAGLAAALITSQLDIDTLIIDENHRIGGQLIKQTHKFFGSSKGYAGVRGTEIAERLVNHLEETGTKLATNTSVVGYFAERKGLIALQNNNRLIEVCPKRIIIATGSLENYLVFPNNDLPGVCGAGGVQTMMNVYGIKPGNKALMVGSGNVGLIVAYQLLQAGVAVEAVVEAMPRIGGYQVHASKLRRMGVPILTSHSIKHAIGTDFVEGAAIFALDDKRMPIEKSEQELEVDLICLAVGLTPSSELAFQMGCEGLYISELGGYVPIHNKDLETSRKGVYIAGDAAGIGEADSAILEGKIAGVNTSLSLGVEAEKANKIKKNAINELNLLQRSPFTERLRIGKQKVASKWEQK